MMGQLYADGEVILSQVDYAKGLLARGRGWLGYEDSGLQGIWLPQTRAVHTIGMRMALDLIWLDSGGYCCQLQRDVPAWRIVYNCQASGLIELRCGLINKVKGVHFSWRD
jgi:uncharacterized membrane protein (UPF0127 family)